jgi:hypothetical protein
VAPEDLVPLRTTYAVDAACTAPVVYEVAAR